MEIRDHLLKNHDRRTLESNSLWHFRNIYLFLGDFTFNRVNIPICVAKMGIWCRFLSILFFIQKRFLNSHFSYLISNNTFYSRFAQSTRYDDDHNAKEIYIDIKDILNSDHIYSAFSVALLIVLMRAKNRPN